MPRGAPPRSKQDPNYFFWAGVLATSWGSGPFSLGLQMPFIPGVPSGGREDLSGHNVAYHPLLENYQAMLKIAAIKLWL